MKLKAKIALNIGLLILFTSTLLGTVTYLTSQSSLEKAIFKEKEEQLDRISQRIENEITYLSDEILFFSQSPIVQNLIHFGSNKSETHKDLTLAFWKTTMTDLFFVLLKEKPKYFAVRYINEKGQEEIVVQSNVQKDPEIVSPEKLQNKSAEDYFKATMQLSAREVYISPMDLNREFGKIEIPHRPVVRFATPLFDAEKNPKGLIIINIDATQITKKGDFLAEELYCLNEEGYFLEHPDSSKKFGFQLGNDYRIQTEHPSIAKKLQEEEKLVFSLEDEQQLKVFGFKKIFYNPLSKKNYWAFLFALPASNIFKPSYELRNQFIWVGGGIVLIAMFLGYLWAGQFSRPIAALASISQRISNGDLVVMPPLLAQEDEVGTLTQTFFKMTQNLREMMQEVQGGTNVLAASVSQILTSSQQLTTSTTETSTSISEATSSLEELKQTAELSSKKAKNVLESSEKATRITLDGKKAVEESIGRMNHIREQMSIIAESVTKLSEQSQTIGEITTSVNELAEQSNLLSVNASIEAAKAGEHGKGFAVVAQEIKNLAQQSKQATAQVRSILNDIQKSIHHSVELTREGNKAVEIGVKQSLSAGESIQILSQSVHESAQVASQIVASSQQELAGIEQIVIAMKQIQEASSQNLEACLQIEESMTSLSALGQKLKQWLGNYKVS